MICTEKEAGRSLAQLYNKAWENDISFMEIRFVIGHAKKDADTPSIKTPKFICEARVCGTNAWKTKRWEATTITELCEKVNGNLLEENKVFEPKIIEDEDLL